MSDKNNIKLTICYNGINNLGYQDNQSGKTVEGSLKVSLEKVLQEKIKLQAASRTDSGVHAKAQVVNFFSETTLKLDVLVFRLNQLLPQDIRVLKAEIMPFNFHPALDAKSKTYLYYVNKNKVQMPHMRFVSWHVTKQLDIELMRIGAKILVGKHDFSAFSNDISKKPVRIIFKIEIIEKDPVVVFKIEGESFLYKMVRNIVGTLIYIGIKKINIKSLESILHSKDRKLAGPTAPAYGLFLEKIKY